MGTAFLATHESFAHDYHKQRIIDARPGSTRLTEDFHINWPRAVPRCAYSKTPSRVASAATPSDPGRYQNDCQRRRSPHQAIQHRFTTAQHRPATSKPWRSMLGTGADKIERIV